MPASAPQRAIRQLMIAIALAATSGVIFFAALIAGELAALPDGAGYQRQIEVIVSAEESQALADSWMPVQLHPAPVYQIADPARSPTATFRHAFDSSNNDEPQGLYLTWKRRVAEVRLNGQRLSARTPVQPPTAVGGFDPVIFEMPRDLLLPRGNVLEFTVLGNRLKILPAFFVGNLQSQFDAYAWSRMISVELVVASVGVMAFIILLCLVTPWPKSERRRANALVLLLIAWSVRNLSFFGFDGVLPSVWQQVIHYQVTFCFLVALARFSAAWTQREVTPGWIFAIVAALLCTLAALTGLTGSSGSVFRWLFPVETMLTAIVAVIAGYQFLRYGAAGSWTRRYEAVLFGICLFALAIDALDDRYNLSAPFLPDVFLTFYTAPVCGLLLALGSVTILVRQSQLARHMVENLNQVLDSRLADQEQALKDGHAREQRADRAKAILEERQRLMRDMHDGLGGQLTSLLVRLRRGKASTSDAEQDVAHALDDLRLIVSSLDHADENLGLALGAFRERIEPRLSETGLDLTWQLEADTANCQISVADMLNVLRFLQEAFTNVLRHANASRIDLKLVRSQQDQIVICVDDNGRGFHDTRSAGKGLKNMRYRAEQLGGHLTVQTGSEGTQVALAFPISPTSR
ncbi:MAG: sensor histidine kinase [Lysobacterales bacterium]